MLALTAKYRHCEKELYSDSEMYVYMMVCKYNLAEE
jgi:hypothetical protein